jgi:hypothetical protein
MMTTQQRWMVIGGLLALTLLGIYMVQEPAEEISLPETSKKIVTQQKDYEKSSIANSQALASQSAIKVAQPELAVLPDLTQKHLFAEDKTNKNLDLFRGHAWYVPPPPPKPVAVKLEPPPPPAAPPVPFFYMGKLEQAPQATQVFLTANNKVLSVTVGKNVDTLWRLDKEEANTLTFTYLPLGLAKQLSKATKQPAVNKAVENPDGSS